MLFQTAADKRYEQQAREAFEALKIAGRITGHVWSLDKAFVTFRNEAKELKEGDTVESVPGKSKPTVFKIERKRIIFLFRGRKYVVSPDGI